MTTASPALEQLELNFLTDAPAIDWTGIEAVTMPEPVSTAQTRKKRQYATRGLTSAELVNEMKAYPQTLASLMKTTGRSRQAVWKVLQRLRMAGAVVKMERGFYGLTFGSFPALKSAASFNLPGTGSRAVTIIV